MSLPIIVEGGASAAGWSRIGTFLRCPRLFWARHVDPARTSGPIAFPLARGLIGHAALAQRFARLGAMQAGRSIDEFATEGDGMTACANALGPVAGQGVLAAFQAALDGVDAHNAAFPIEAEQDRVRAVEYVVETEFDGFPYTVRFDLVTEDRGGGIWVTDHKFVGRVEDKTFARYALSGQFLGIAWLAERKWGAKFAGVKLNVCGCRDKKVIRRQIEPAPYALRRFPALVADAEREILALSAADGDEWPMRIHEQVCTSAYGPCDEFERCRWGTKV